MSGYDAVKRAMAAGTPLELICASCPWDRLCVKPPAMDSAEVERRIGELEAKGSSSPNPDGAMAGVLIAALAYAGKDSMGEMCPVFATRLRSPEGRQIADHIRKTMLAVA